MSLSERIYYRVAASLTKIGATVGPKTIFTADPEDKIPATEKSKSLMHELFYRHDGKAITKWRNYLSVYDRYFIRYRNAPVRVLEIGVLNGGSLSLWRKYFGEDAILFGIDINPACATLGGNDAEVRIGSQADPEFLQSVVKEMGGVDIVIDDGSHVANHQLISFRTLFPLLDENGIYICEDTHTAYWPSYEGGYRRSTSFIEVAKSVVDDMHSDFHTRGEGVEGACRSIKGIHFFNSMVVIEKEPQPTPAPIVMPSE